MKDKENKKILFITFNDISVSNFGGVQFSRRNLEFLNHLGKVDIWIIRKRSNIDSIKSGLNLLFPPLSISDKHNIVNILNNERYDCVFLDNSLLGSVAKWIARLAQVPTLTYFQNVEIDYINVRFGRGVLKYPYKFLAWVSERNSIKYSNKIIALNNRDRLRIENVYKRKCDATIPITLKSTITNIELQEKYKKIRLSGEKLCLFVGAISNSNYTGIKWFIENIANKINATIQIIGTGFEQKRQELTRKNVDVIGYVEDLESFYLNADCVISPLLFGGGMKVKIAEAMMYGKTIFATTEAFEGYEINYKKIGGLCNTPEEFLLKINEFLLNPQKYNEYSRKVFETVYSNKVALLRFNELLGDLIE